MIESITLFLLLLFETVTDLKKKEIWLIPIMATAVLGMVYWALFHRLDGWQLLGGTAIGAVLLGIGFASGQKVGYGDGLLVMTTGLYLGFWPNLILLWLAAFLCGVFGLAQNMIRGKRKDREIPFAPFVLLSEFLIFVLEGGKLPGGSVAMI